MPSLKTPAPGLIPLDVHIPQMPKVPAGSDMRQTAMAIVDHMSSLTTAVDKLASNYQSLGGIVLGWEGRMQMLSDHIEKLVTPAQEEFRRKLESLSEDMTDTKIQRLTDERDRLQHQVDQINQHLQRRHTSEPPVSAPVVKEVLKIGLYVLVICAAGGIGALVHFIATSAIHETTSIQHEGGH